MSRIAVVGCEASGKTVFTAALTDYFKPGTRPNQTCCLIAENAATHRFSEYTNFQMRVRCEWPQASNPDHTTVLKWSFRENNTPFADVEMLEFGGEVFRAAFRESGSVLDHQKAVEDLRQYLCESDYVIVLVSLTELMRALNGSDASPDMAEFERDTESKWVTRGLLEFVTQELPKGTGLLIALTQADKFRAELESFGSARALFLKAWPMIASMFPDVPVVSVASVSDTDETGRPVKGYKTDGILTVMREFSRFTYGDGEKARKDLEAVHASITAPTGPIAPIQANRLANQYENSLKKLGVGLKIYMSDADSLLASHTAFFESYCALLAEASAAEDADALLPVDEAFWKGLIEHHADFAPFLKALQEGNAQECAAKEAEAAKIRAAEEEQRRQEEEQRRKEEEERAAAAKAIEAAEQLAREEKARQRAEDERRAAQELEKRRLQLEVTRAEADKANAKAAMKRRRGLLTFGIFLCALLACAGGGVFWYLYQRDRAAAELKTQQLATARQAAAERKSREDRLAREADMKKAEAEKAKAEAEKAKAVAEAEKAQAEAEKAAAEKDRVQAEAEKAAAEKEKITAAKAKAETELKLAEESRLAAERKAAEKAEAELRAKLDRVCTAAQSAVESGNLALARRSLEILRKYGDKADGDKVRRLAACLVEKENAGSAGSAK